MKYHDQLKHPLWQKKRLEVMELFDFKCVHCGSKEDQLNVHHPYYNRGAMIWQYECYELLCLCNKCHKEEHAIDDLIKKELATTCENKNQIIGYLLHPNAQCGNYLQAIGMLDSLHLQPTESLALFVENNRMTKAEIMCLVGQDRYLTHKKLSEDMTTKLFGNSTGVV